MNKSLNNKLSWVWVIVLVILPSILVRVIDGDSVRVFGIIILLGFLPIFLFLASVFVTKKGFFLNPDSFEQKHGEAALNRFSFALRAVGVVGGIFLFAWATIPGYIGIFNYYILKQPLVSVEGVVTDLNTGIIDPIGFINQSIQFENGAKSYSFWYPDYRLRVGESHNLQLLPGTNIVLRAQPVQIRE